MKLTRKEQMLIKDLKSGEQLCAEKYDKGAKAAKDTQLQTLFTELAQIEKKHYNMLCSIESGENVQIKPKQSGNKSKQKTFTAVYKSANTASKQNDCFLCNDALAAEKHASALYDTCVFEFTQENTRNVLNHIQGEEQQHGKYLFDYMQTNGMKA